MFAWKELFTKTTLEKSEKSNAKITNVEHTCSNITGTLSGKKDFKITLIVEKDELFDMNCSCSSKTNCVHIAVFLSFIEEFPEILEDHKEYYDKEKSILNVDHEQMLKNVSSTRLNSFLKQELKHNNKFKYDFIKYFQEKSLIDARDYEKKLKSIFSNSKSPGFKYHGFYSMDKLSKPLKTFMRTDIKKLLDTGEYTLACKLLNNIIDTLSDTYMEDIRFDNIFYYYQDYAEILLQTGISEEDKNEIIDNLELYRSFGY